MYSIGRIETLIRDKVRERGERNEEKKRGRERRKRHEKKCEDWRLGCQREVKGDEEE